MTPQTLLPAPKKKIIHYMDKQCATCLYWYTSDHSVRQWGECLATTQLTHRSSDCNRWKLVHMSVKKEGDK